MKLKKKFKIIIVILFSISILCSLYLIISNYINKGIFDLEDYKDLKLEDIKSINVIEKPDKGFITNTYNENKDIKKIYNKLDKKRLGRSRKAIKCDDVITYDINTKDNTYTVEIECNLLKVNSERYILK